MKLQNLLLFILLALTGFEIYSAICAEQDLQAYKEKYKIRKDVFFKNKDELYLDNLDSVLSNYTYALDNRKNKKIYIKEPKEIIEPKKIEIIKSKITITKTK